MTSAQQGQNFDPFEQGEGVKSVSFKDAPHGSMLTIQIDDDAKWLQTRDFKTGEPAYWDARPGETPNPKMAAVVTGVVAPTPWAVQSGQAGERRSIWAEKPSNLFTAIQNAKRAAGGGTALPILNGGTLDIAFVGEEPAKDPRNNPIKQYQARYTPPPAGFGQQDAFEGGQAFTGQQAQPQQQFAQQAPVQQPAPQQQFAQQAPVQQPAPQQQFAQGGYVGGPAPQQPAATPFGQQAPAPQQQPATPFGQQAPAPQQPVATPFGQQAPAPQQQPAMAGAPAGGDPWAAAPSADVPNF